MTQTKITPGVLREAQAWVADCMGRRGLAPVAITVRYVARHYPGGWVAFDEMCLMHSMVR